MHSYIPPRQAPITSHERTTHARIASSNLPRFAMLYYAVVFLIIAIVAALFGFGGIAAGAAGIAKVLFVLFLIGAVIAFVVGMRRPRI